MSVLAMTSPTVIAVTSVLPEGWSVTSEGRKKSLGFDTRQLAELYARQLAKRNRPSLVKVYSQSGKLEMEVCYGANGG